MAQLVEHILGKDEVISSNLISSSKSGKLRLAAFSFSFVGVDLIRWGARLSPFFLSPDLLDKRGGGRVQ